MAKACLYVARREGPALYVARKRPALYAEQTKKYGSTPWLGWAGWAGWAGWLGWLG